MIAPQLDRKDQHRLPDGSHTVCAPVERSGQDPRLSLVAVHPHVFFNFYIWLRVWIEGNPLV